MWEMNWHTPELLSEFGFTYDSTLMDSDHPYELAVGASDSLVELPVSWALDDWQQYCFVPDFSGTGLIETPPRPSSCGDQSSRPCGPSVAPGS